MSVTAIYAGFDNQLGQGWRWFILKDGKWRRSKHYYRTYIRAYKAGQRKAEKV
ncbi:hypothetical protein LCGC14_1218120 [marine sediment metagenome]|uniref:Uncharacterized protein n=1 Tax=marine sediment metagenome TaxID=412755 RepID=A0A0F9PGN8_9ZZZZ